MRTPYLAGGGVVVKMIPTSDGLEVVGSCFFGEWFTEEEKRRGEDRRVVDIFHVVLDCLPV